MSRGSVAFAAVLLAGLTGCAERADAPLSPTFGMAVASLQAQIVPPAAVPGPAQSSAARGIVAVTRYERGQPRALETAPTSNVAQGAPAPMGGPDLSH
jgi:hypothetical protein